MREEYDSDESEDMSRSIAESDRSGIADEAFDKENG